MNDPILNSYGYVFNEKFITYSQIENLKYPKQTQIQSEFTEIESFFHELGPTHVNFVWPLSNKGTNENGGGDKHDYSKDYLTFTALEDTTFTFTQNALQYSLDDGANWFTLPANTATPTVTKGNKIMWKQNGLTATTGMGTFSAIGNFDASGNIMSLLYGDDFVGQTDLIEYVFTELFGNNTNLVSTENLILPATTLENGCYKSMFYGCTSLASAPELPATTLAYYCYNSMFLGCTLLEFVDIYSNEIIVYTVYNNSNNSGKLVLHGQTPLASQDSFLQQFLGWELWIDDTFIGIIEKTSGYYYNY